jgi:hypothetical protein
MGLSGYKKLMTDAERIQWLKRADMINSINIFFNSLVILLVWLYVVS